jgi:biotin operon repressor
MTRSARPMSSKASAEIILIPKHLRMDWMDVLGTDRNLAPASYKVAGAIGTHFDNKSGMTYVSQKTIAKVTGLSIATVGRAIIDLEQRGYIIIQRREIGERGDGRKVYGGKGVANVYLPAVDAVQISATDRGQRLVALVRKRWEESLNGDASKHITDDVLSEPKQIMGDVLNDRDSTSNTSVKQRTGDVPTLNLPTEGNSSRSRGPSSTNVLGPAGAALKLKLGSDVYGAWFDKLTIEAETAEIVTLAAPTRFLASRVKQDFETHILTAWQATTPTVKRIDIIVKAERGKQ